VSRRAKGRRAISFLPSFVYILISGIIAIYFPYDSASPSTSRCFNDKLQLLDPIPFDTQYCHADSETPCYHIRNIRPSPRCTYNLQPLSDLRPRSHSRLDTYLLVPYSSPSDALQIWPNNIYRMTVPPPPGPTHYSYLPPRQPPAPSALLSSSHHNLSLSHGDVGYGVVSCWRRDGKCLGYGSR
jgi:hypothetical protein